MPVSTLRAWVIGLFWAVIIAAMNQFFFLRVSTVMIGNVRPCIVQFREAHVFTVAFRLLLSW